MALPEFLNHFMERWPNILLDYVKGSNKAFRAFLNGKGSREIFLPLKKMLKIAMKTILEFTSY